MGYFISFNTKLIMNVMDGDFMDIGNIDLRPCKYRLKSCIFKIEGRSDFEINPNYVSEIYIDKDFDNMAYPYFELTVMLPPSTYRDMRKKNSELRCYMELQRAYTDLQMNQASNSNELNFRTFIQDTFYIFLVDNTPELQSNFTETYESAAGLKQDEYGAGDAITTRILLYNEEFFFRGRTIVNAVLQDATLLDGILYTINKANLRNMLISPPDNITKYNQLILPPISASEQLLRLVADYAMYEVGATVFFDFDRGYVLDNYNACTVWEPDEIKQVYIISKEHNDDSSSMKTGSYEDPARKFYAVNIEAGRASFSNGSLLADQSQGTDVISIDTQTGEIHNVNSNAKTAGLGNTSQIVVSNTGEDTSKALAYTLKNTSRIAKIKLSNIDIDIFKPNKEYLFSFDTANFEEYMGSYHIMRFTADLQKDGDLFVCSASAEFKGYDLETDDSRRFE